MPASDGWVPPDRELTPAEYLVADLVSLGERFPGGYQVALGIRLGHAVAAVEELFTAKGLPMREELIAELTLWRCHVEEGLVFAQHTE